MMKPAGTRLVVTGQNAEGRSVIVSDEVVAPVMSAIATTPLWTADAPPRFPLNGERPATTTMFPPVGGHRFLIMTIPPDSEAGAWHAASSAADAARAGTGAGDYMEADTPGMHTTDTIDFEVVLSGEASQEFDDGQVVHLKTGDCFVQNGTRHRWFNRGSEPAVVAVVLIGGHPRGVSADSSAGVGIGTAE